MFSPRETKLRKVAMNQENPILTPSSLSVSMSSGVKLASLKTIKANRIALNTVIAVALALSVTAFAVPVKTSPAMKGRKRATTSRVA